MGECEVDSPWGSPLGSAGRGAAGRMLEHPRFPPWAFLVGGCGHRDRGKVRIWPLRMALAQMPSLCTLSWRGEGQGQTVCPRPGTLSRQDTDGCVTGSHPTTTGKHSGASGGGEHAREEGGSDFRHDGQGGDARVFIFPGAKGWRRQLWAPLPRLGSCRYLLPL